MDDVATLNTALAGHYVIDRELGAGGMATVYLAEDVKHRRKVAVKVLRSDLAASVGATRFLREIEIAAQLQHPNVLGLLDSGDANGLLYYVMPFVEGQSLRQRLQRETELPVGEAVRIIVEIVDALAYAHSRGVVHRDIKPDNVMLSGRHALVADFGVARALSDASGEHAVTSLGIALGTPAYMSPEQATADPHVDHRADIYAIGVVAYELLTGRPPFTGATPQQILAAQVTEPAVPVSRNRPGISHALEQIVMKCLEKRPADRWQTADELLRALEPLATPSGGTQPTSARLSAASAMPSRAMKPWLFAAVAGLIVALAVFAWPRVSRRDGASASSPVSVGAATPLTTGDALEIQPAVSPDGKLVAYATGRATRMRIFIRSTSGGRTIPISDDSMAFEFQPRWSPDGTQILYMTRDGAFVAPALGGAGRRIASAAEGLELSGTTNRLRLGITAAAWSPDGALVAIGRGGRLSVVGVRGGDEKELLTADFEFHSCDWSPNGKWIACVSGNVESVVPGNAYGNIAPSAIVLIPAVGGLASEIVDRRAANLCPVWSADGARLFFVSNRQGSRDIYSVEVSADGKTRGEPARVTTGLGLQSFDFSGDGTRLVYAVYTSRANAWSLPIPSASPGDGTTAEQVTTGNQNVEAMSVSFDRKWLVYDSNLSGNADIYRIPTTGGAPERLTSDAADEFAGSLSPDGRELTFHSWKTGSRDIVVQPVAGGPSTLVTNSPSHESFPRWSPDGTALVYYDQLIERGAARGAFVMRRNATGVWGAPVQRVAGAVASWSTDGRLLTIKGDTLGVFPADSGEGQRLYAPRAGTEDPVPERVFASDDSKTLYFKSHDSQGRATFWSLPIAGGAPRLLVRLADLARPSIRADFAVGAGRLFFTREERQSDVWVADVVAR